MSNDKIKTKLRRVDPVLAAIFVAGSVLAVLLVRRAHEWGLMTDELLYTQLGRSIWSSGLPIPRVHGQLVPVFQVLFPLLISPIVGTLKAPEAYPVVAAFNAILMVAAAIPAYLMTKFITGDRAAARLVALCVAVMPWLAFATKTMTDPLALTIFVWAVYMIVRAVAEPSGSRDLQAFAVFVLAFLTRNQFVVLPPVFCAAIGARAVVEALGDGRPAIGSVVRSLVVALRAHWAAFAATIALALVVFLKPFWILGIYSTTSSSARGAVVPSNLLHSMLSHFGIVAVGLGALPMVLALPWITTALARARQPRENSAALTFTIVTLVMLFVAASFDSRYSLTDQIYERYIFYIAPLLLISAAALFVNPPRRWAAFVIPTIVGVLIVRADQHYGLNTALTFDLSFAFSPVQVFIVKLQEVADALALPSVTIMLVLIAIVGAALSWWGIAAGRARLTMHLVLGFTAAFCLFGTLYTVPKVVQTQNRLVDHKLGYHRTTADKTWVDNAVPKNAKVALVDYSINLVNGKPVDQLGLEQTNWWDAELWNKSIDSYYAAYVPAPTYGAFSARPSHIYLDYATGKMNVSRKRPREWYLFSQSDPRFAPFTSAPVVSRNGQSLYKAGVDPQAQWATRGVTVHGLLPIAKPAVMRVYSKQGTTGGATIARVSLLIELKAAYTQGFTVGKLPKLGATSVITRDVCLPAGGHADLSLDARAVSNQLHGDLKKTTPRLLQTTVRPSSRPCSP